MMKNARRILAFLLVFHYKEDELKEILLTVHADEISVESSPENNDENNTEISAGPENVTADTNGQDPSDKESKGQSAPEGEQDAPAPSDGEQGGPAPTDGEQGGTTPSDGEQGDPVPSDGEQGDPVPSDEEQNGAEQYSFEDSGEYVRVSIAGSCAGEEKPTAHAAELRDDEKYAVLEAWTVDDLCDDCSLKLTAEMTALPELSEGEHLALVPVCGENVGEALDVDMEAGDKLELELARHLL